MILIKKLKSAYKNETYKSKRLIKQYKDPT